MFILTFEQAGAVGWRQLPDVLKQISQGPQSCAESSEAPLSSTEELIDFVCSEFSKFPEDEFKKKFKLRAGEGALKNISGGTLALDQLYDCLSFFTLNNRKIQTAYENFNEDQWSLSERGVCKFLTHSKNSVQEMKFDDLSFIGIQHFYNQDDVEIKKSQGELSKRILGNSDAIVIESYKIGSPVKCQNALIAAFTSDVSLKDESQFLIKSAFLNKIAILPGDNLFPDESDRRLFFKDSISFEKAKKEALFIDVLHSYSTHLRKKSASPLSDAIAESYGRRGVSPVISELDFRARYRELNKSELPSDLQILMQDFTPSEFVKNPKATNFMIDGQDRLRNQALLTSTQVAKSLYSKPAVVFGNSHLAKVGAALEMHSKKITNVDFKGTCPPELKILRIKHLSSPQGVRSQIFRKRNREGSPILF